MEVEKNLLETLKARVAIKFGNTPRTPTDFNLLSSEITKVTGLTIGISTLKRIWGYVPSNHGTTYSTLSLLSKYVGYSDWDAFQKYVVNKTDSAKDETSGFGNAIIMSEVLTIGTEIELQWSGDKMAVLRKIEEKDKFRLMATKNIKLQPGDTGRISNIALGSPLIIMNVKRKERNFGIYTGATGSGICSIRILTANGEFDPTKPSTNK